MQRPLTSILVRTRQFQSCTRSADLLQYSHRVEFYARLGSYGVCYQKNLPYVYRHLSVSHLGDQARSRDTSSGWTKSCQHVAVGGSGSVQLDVYTLPHRLTNPSATSSIGEEHLNSKHAGSDTDSCADNAEVEEVLVYLPPGPTIGIQESSLNLNQNQNQEFGLLLQHLAHEHAIGHSLRRTPTTVLCFNYRLEPKNNSTEDGEDFRFPIAIHDVSRCLDWALDFAKAEYSSDASISLYGSNIGGTLALTMALTNPNAIHAVVAKDPVTDWTNFDDLASSPAPDPDEAALLTDDVKVSDTSNLGQNQRKQRRSARSRPDTQAAMSAEIAQRFIELRTRLFRTPSGFFDPFASPLLFLRAPGRDTPLWKTARPEIGVGSVIDGLHGSVGAPAFGPYDDDWHAAGQEQINLSTTEQGKVNEDLDTIAEAIGADAMPTATDDDDASKLNSLTAQACNLSVDSGTDASEWQSVQALTTPNKNEDFSRPLSSIHVAYPPSQTLASSLAEATQNLARTTTAEDISASQTCSPVKTTKRRKVLRRWPSVGHAEDILLPHVGIFATPPDPIPDLDKTHTPSLPTENAPPNPAILLYPQAKELVEIMRRACFWGRDRLLAEERVNLHTLNLDPTSTTPSSSKGSSTTANSSLSSPTPTPTPTKALNDTMLQITKWLMTKKD